MAGKITKHILYAVLVREAGDKMFRHIKGHPNFRSEDMAQQSAESLRIANPDKEYFVQKSTQYSGLTSRF